MELEDLVPTPAPDGKKRIAIGSVLKGMDDSPVTLEAWRMIHEAVEGLAKASMGEYTTWQVSTAIYTGEVTLSLAYVNDTGKDLNDFEQKAFVWDKLLRDQKNGYIGYFITRRDNTNLHIWHAYIAPEYQSSEVFMQAFAKIKELAQFMKAPALTFSSTRDGWGKAAINLGFKEAYTIYRMEL